MKDLDYINLGRTTSAAANKLDTMTRMYYQMAGLTDARKAYLWLRMQALASLIISGQYDEPALVVLI